LKKDNNELAKALRNLNANIEILTKVTALALRKDSIFKDKATKQEQVEALEDLKLPDNVIALTIGSTVESVQTLRSQRKAKAKKAQETEPKQEEVQHKQ